MMASMTKLPGADHHHTTSFILTTYTIAQLHNCYLTLFTRLLDYMTYFLNCYYYLTISWTTCLYSMIQLPGGKVMW